MEYIITNIRYDTDGENIELPDTLRIQVEDSITDEQEIEDFISNKISDITGFCHFGFNIKSEEIDTIIKILYQNSHDTGSGLEIDFSNIHKVIKLLQEDKIKFTKTHVAKALMEVCAKAQIYRSGNDEDLDSIDTDSVFQAYPLGNIK